MIELKFKRLEELEAAKRQERGEDVAADTDGLLTAEEQANLFNETSYFTVRGLDVQVVGFQVNRSAQ